MPLRNVLLYEFIENSLSRNQKKHCHRKYLLKIKLVYFYLQAVSEVRKMNCENCQIMSQSYQVLAFLGHERSSQRPCIIRFNCYSLKLL